MRANRAFLSRSVRFLTAEVGIRQFLDIGAGLPTADNIHEVAQCEAADSLVVYADNDRCKSGCAHGAPHGNPEREATERYPVPDPPGRRGGYIA